MTDETRNLEEEKNEFPEPTPELKKYMAEVDEKRKNEWIGKIPHWIVSTGLLEALRPEAVKVLAVLIRWADFVRGIGRVGNERIIRESGVKGISDYFKELREWGVIKVWKKGWRRYYQVQASPPGDIQLKIEDFHRNHELNKYPLPAVTYSRDSKTGKFTKK